MTTDKKTKLFRAVTAALALALVPSFALAQSKRAAPASTGGSGVGTIALGGTLGVDFGSDNVGTGLRIEGDGYYALAMLAPNLAFDLGGHLGFIHNGCSIADCSFNTFEIVPTARFRYLLTPLLSLYGDGGLGLAFVNTSLPAPLPSDTSTGGVLRFALGGQYKIGNQLYLVGQPATFNIYFKDGSNFHYSVQVGLLARL